MKKGFTLVELLAVIIILAVIALIATPIVVDVIDDAKDSVAYTETQRIVEGITNYCQAMEMKKQMGTFGGEDVDCAAAQGVKTTNVSKMVDLKKAEVTAVSYTGGKVASITVKSNGRTITFNGSTYSKASN